ncbi:MAG TPA: cation acetate symporter [Geminicoccaceae bacterium]|nr:cation acetate symporter [Geminicoccus sp.]HMU50814.1 cation acetate symporter [Geminicoccaceae bacterium]
MQDSFVSNLGRIYATYTGGFVAFVILLAILSALGVPDQIIGYMFVLLTIAVYAGIGYISRTAQVSEYYVAGRRVPAMYNGMATAADWMSAASFIGMAGSLYAQGYDGLAFILGWTGGFVLVAVLIAPYLRKFGAYTVPDFLAARYGGTSARVIGVVILVVCSFTYLMGQLVGTGIIASRLLGVSTQVGVFVGLAGILVCSMLGGMRAVTWTQVAQYIVLIIAYLIPVVILSTQVTGIPVPQLTYGGVLQQITGFEQAHGGPGGFLEGAAPHATPFTVRDPLNYFGLILCLMVGTASLPHVIMRFFTTPSVRDARKSVGWSLLFIFILYFTAPAYAVFAKFEVFSNVLGKDISTLAAIQELPSWIFSYGRIGLVKICGANAVDPQVLFDACQAVKDAAGAAAPVTTLTFKQFSINPDTVVLATPEIAGLPYVITGLVAAGGLAAALSTADGLLLAIANALSHDVYYKMIDHRASTARRLIVARVLLVVVALVAAYTAISAPAGILIFVSWAFSFAAAGLFPALVLGIWWKRCTSSGAVLGMIAGFSVTLFYTLNNYYWGGSQWFGVNHIAGGVFGIPVGFLVIWLVSLATPAPSRELQELVDSIRIPKGEILTADGRQTS